MPALDDGMLQLAATVRARDPPHITGQELSAIMKWKLAKGKFRPRLQQFVDAADPGQVRTASTAAFKHLAHSPGGAPKPACMRKALEAMTAFKGVGPATASAVLALACDAVPFMSDEALEAALPKREYTVKAFLGLAEALQAMAQRAADEEGDAASAVKPLSDACTGADLSGCEWSAQLVQLALYAAGTSSKKLHCSTPEEVEKLASTEPQPVPSETRKRPRQAGAASRGSKARRR